MTCSYAFTDANGKPVLITGKESFKAYLVSGGLANFNINLQSDKGEAKFSRSGGSLPDTITVNAPGVLFTDENDNAIVYEREGFRISVNRPGAASYVVLWAKQEVNGKTYWRKAGALDTNQKTKKVGGVVGEYLGVSSIEIEKAYRAQGLGLEMYRALMANAAPNIAGVISHTPNRVNKQQVPSIYRKLGAFTDGDNQIIPIGRNEPPSLPVNTGVSARMVVIDKPAESGPAVLRTDTLPDTITVNGVERPTTNSTGKPIHPTEEGVRNFYKWFGASKAVDKDGKPLVVYHGTTENFDSFNPSLAGAVGDKFASASFFTSSPTIAAGYAQRLSKDAEHAQLFADEDALRSRYGKAVVRQHQETGATSGDISAPAKAAYDAAVEARRARRVAVFSNAVPIDGANIAPVYLRIESPAEIDADGGMYFKTHEKAFDKAKKSDADGVIVRNVIDRANEVMGGASDVFAVFNPTQIKSAIGNNGDFSPESPNITYSRTSLISPAQRALTRTDAFKEWFGSSKMTAQDGTPLLFMHGTPAKFDAFDSKHVGANSSHTSAGLGHFFTREVGTAQRYADGGTILKGWIKMERPYVMPLKEAQAFESAKDSAARRMELQQKGYDGAVILDDQGKPWATVAFHPWQFKSTENKGGFDEFDDRFRFSRTNQGQAGAWPIEPIGKGDRFIYNMQNKQIDTKRVVEAAKKSGVNVTDDINPYLQEELYHGRSAKKFDDFRNKELRPLLDSIRAAGLSIADVESYLWASHAKERNAQIAKINDKMPDGGSGLTNKQADDLLAGRSVTVNGNEIKGVSQSALPVMQGIAKQVQAINAATRQMLVDSGMETADTIKAWEGAYSNYVPLHREDIEQGGMGTGMGFSVRGSASKRAIGSGRTVVDILGNIANQRERQIARVEKNRVGQAVLGLAKSAPNEDFWKVDDVPMMKTVEATPVFTAYDKAGKILGTYSTQLQADRAHPSAGVTVRRTVEDKVKSRMDPTFRSKEEVFHVRVDGKDHFVTFNPQDERSMRMAMALKNLDADQLGAVLQVTSKATRFFASMATQYNPIWGVVNLTRDVQGALLNLSTTDLKGKEKEVLGHTLSALKGIYADLRAHRAGKKPSSKWASLFEEMQDEGGQTGYKDMFGNAKDRTEALERELDPTKWMKSPLGRIFTADGRLKVPMEIAQKRAEGFFGWLSDFNQTTENAIRLASYKTAVDSGMSKQQAASIAKNVSINFNRKGQVATQAGALYAFFNASMQGSARLAETLRGPLGKKIIKGGLALGVMQAMMLSAAGMGDDEPPEFVRERSFIIPTGDGKYFSIPLPLGFHVLPNLSRIPTEYAMSGFKNGGKRIADLFGLVADTFNPIGNAGLSLQTIAPTVIDPLAALAENKDYTGKRIAKDDMSSLHPTPGYLRAKDTASEISKYFAKVFNAASGGTEFKKGEFSPTPDQLDYLIGQVLGGVGREALKIDQTISSAVTGEELPMHKVPLLGRFVGDTKGQSAESGKFYAALTRINEHQAELKGLRASGRSAEAAEYAKENPEARLVLMATATERALSEDHKLKRKAIAAGNSDLVKQIEARSSARMKAFNERLAALEN